MIPTTKRCAAWHAIAPKERTKASVYHSHTFFTVYAVDTRTPAGDTVSTLVKHRISAFVLPRRLDARTAPELDPLYADLYDHVLRASEWTESLRDMVTTVFETNLSLQDARLNTVMKKLTGWAAIIAVPTAITGFYGQNVVYPGINTVVGFIASSALIVVLVVLLYIMFKRRDWL